MYRIKSVTFKDHPILDKLHLDFCDLSGRPVDTVIIAGENGTGKSTILEALFAAISFASGYELSLDVDDDGVTHTLSFEIHDDGSRRRMYLNDHESINSLQTVANVKDKYAFHGIYSDVDINFKGGIIESVKSGSLDENKDNRRSTSDLPTQIKQLIVDVQASDDADTAESVRIIGSTTRKYEDIKPGNRMQRFINAFNKMFDGLTYSKVENANSKKSIIFLKNGKEVEIDNLSSGEKQIVYRGCFLLKDIGSLSGAFAFIDEPEISLHPEWQKKILDYYKGIFTDADGKQTSQLFIVTHSPFIIHNKTRHDDKVLVLQRDADGVISALDKPEYYICESSEPVKDAFNVDDFDVDTAKTVVYLEGRTDENYFKKAVEVFGYADLPFEFQWVGHLQKNGQEEFTGASSLNQAVNFMKGRNPEKPQVFLYDCDTNKTETVEDNIVIMAIPKYDQTGNMNVGIENALQINGINLDDFYSFHTNPKKNYGEETMTKQFEKMKLCNYICDDLSSEEQQKILTNLKLVIDRIINKLRIDGGMSL